MTKYLLSFIVGCSAIDLDDEAQERCGDKIDRVEEVCEQADVIGTNDNSELYKAVDDLKECIGYNVRVICSDPGYGEPKVLTIKG